MKKKILLAGILCVIFLSALAAGVYAYRNMSFSEWGERVKQNRSIPDSEIVATVDQNEITRERFENYKAGLALTQTDYTDSEALDRMIRGEVLYQEIERLGITVTDAEVQAFNEERFAMMEADPTAYQITKDYVDGLGITMEEYKQMSLEISKNSLLTTAYRERLLSEYTVRPGDAKSFEEYYDQRLEQLVKEAKIEMLL